MKKRILTVLGLAGILFVSSCSLEPKLADVESMEVPTTIAMRQLMDGSYVTMANYRYLGRNMIIAGEVRTDNAFSNGQSGRFVRWSAMNVIDTDGDVADLMRYAYGTMANANILIHTDMASVDGSDADKNQILGEAYLMRAYSHFDLMRLFGQRYSGGDLGISYIKEFKGPKNVARGSWDSNVADLKSDIADAISYFQNGQDSEYSDSKTNFNLNAAYALQSRVGIYLKDYAYAKEGSTPIVDSYPIVEADDLVEYWAQQTPPAGAIFELFQNTSTNNQSINGLANIYRGSSYGDVCAFSNIKEDAGFEANDVRASDDMISVNTSWGPYMRNMGKYPAMGTELGADNIKVFRIEEIVLNHAEALAHTGGDGLSYLNMIPAKRNASLYNDASDDNILKERRKELIFEGFRFFDLARMGMDIRDMGEPLNNHGLISAGADKFAFPIPQRELDSNSAAVPNPGY